MLKRLGPQTGGLVTWRDLTALPCSHPHCCSVGYLLQDDGGQWRSLVSLVGADGLRRSWGWWPTASPTPRYPDSCAPRCGESLLGLLSEQSSLSHPQIGDIWQTICELRSRHVDPADPGVLGAAGRRRKLRRLLGERVVRLTVKPFMDMSTMIEERLLQCCVHVGTRSARTSARRSARCRPGRNSAGNDFRSRRAGNCPGRGALNVRRTCRGARCATACAARSSAARCPARSPW